MTVEQMTKKQLLEELSTLRKRAAEREAVDRKLEEQLRQSQKMEAIGQLTGGIAHDFNNILTVIISNAELVAGSLPADAVDQRADLAELRGAAGRGSALIKKLLGFGRQGELVRTPVNLGRLVGELAQVLNRLIPENIQIQIAADESAGTVRADPGAIEQILLNLTTNARDAMPDGGTLRVECRRVQLDAACRATHPWVVPGDYSYIVVSDTGIGMNEETRRSIFEPFFTTKPAGEGTGLGMAMVYGLVKQHEGFVHVYSEPGLGTAVKLYFHSIHEEAESTASDPTNGVGLPVGTETILIVEDEQAIRRATKRVLERCGYATLTACDGQEALDVFSAHGADIDLILTDLVMPKLGGRELYDALRHEGEQVKFILTSGYSAEEVHESASFNPSVPFLHKPWLLTDLLQCVRDVLDEDAGGRRMGTQAFRAR
jgi:two-component system, cell cycle sensor histidine kinase and response regulator CckA